MELQSSFDRHTNNQAILTGRHEGQFFQNGKPRGGPGQVVEEVFVLYKAIVDSTDGVLSVMGLNGKRTPYNEIPPMVEPTRIKRQVIYDGHGRRIGSMSEEL